MAARPTMKKIISRLERLLQPSAGGPWDADAMQDALDEHRTLIRYQCLIAVASFLPGGAVQYKEFIAPPDMTNFEEGATLVDGQYNPLTPTESDLITGRWLFATDQRTDVMVSGAIYDLHGAAADLLEQEVASLRRRAFEVTDGSGATAKRQEMIENIVSLIAAYRKRQRPTSARMGRSDVC
jgi:hypothetical protein